MSGAVPAPGEDRRLPPHAVGLPGTDWTLWRDAQIRSAGFPAAGLDRFAAPELARLADERLDGRPDPLLEAAYRAASEEASRVMAEIVEQPLFREAITWQNPTLGALVEARRGHIVDLATDPRPETRRHARRFEDTLCRYWQRYCGKNDTVGFFGPVTWVTLDPDGPPVELRCGDRLVRSREIFYEFWALEAYVRTLCADPLVRPWLPVGMHPHLVLDGDRVRRPGQPAVELSAPEADLVRRCDGRRPAAAVAGGPEAAGELASLERLVEQGVLWWGVDMPYNPGAEAALRATVEAIAEPAAREVALARLARLDAARDAVAAAAGRPEQLAAAMLALDETFTTVTGEEPERRKGEQYAGRRLCYEETVRDVELTIGGPVLEAVRTPFVDVLLPAARWLSAKLAEAYVDAFGSLYEKLRTDGSARVPLADFWSAAQGLVTGENRPVDAVAADLRRRWVELLGLDGVPPGSNTIQLSSADLAPLAAELFEAERPGWPGARIHSPDIHVGARGADALARGEFTVVLGELHTAWPTLDAAVFVDRHPHPDVLYAAAAADIGPQFRPLYPTWWPRYTARIAPVLGATDHQLAFDAAPGADPARVVPITGVDVLERDGVVVAEARDGRAWPVFDVFELVVGWLGTEAFKLASTDPHTPRITIDRLVIARETWRARLGELELCRVGGRLPEYLAARRWRRAAGMPERVFAKIGSEIKPTYVDFTSPRYVSCFATMLRSAWQRGGDGVEVVLSELLPGPDEAWLPDAEGRRYSCELRVQFRDPMPAKAGCPQEGGAA